MMQIQSSKELDDFYAQPDPWNYVNNPHDVRRKNELLSLIPPKNWRRTLDIGCGDGFITFDLPGQSVMGVDMSAAAINWADKKRLTLPANRADAFEFRTESIFNLSAERFGQFDLVVITGVLYKQYIGDGFAVVRKLVDDLLDSKGVLVSCHIDQWAPPKFAYTMLDTVLYPYRDYIHRLEVFQK